MRVSGFYRVTRVQCDGVGGIGEVWCKLIRVRRDKHHRFSNIYSVSAFTVNTIDVGHDGPIFLRSIRRLRDRNWPDAQYAFSPFVWKFRYVWRERTRSFRAGLELGTGHRFVCVKNRVRWRFIYAFVQGGFLKKRYCHGFKLSIKNFNYLLCLSCNGRSIIYHQKNQKNVCHVFTLHFASQVKWILTDRTRTNSARIDQIARSGAIA